MTAAAPRAPTSPEDRPLHHPSRHHPAFTAGHGGERGRGVRLPGGLRRGSAMGRGEVSLGPRPSVRLSVSPPCHPLPAPPGGSGVSPHHPPPPPGGSGGDAAPKLRFLCQQLRAPIFRRYREGFPRSLLTRRPPPAPKSKLQAGRAARLSLRLIISCRLLNCFSGACSETVGIKGTPRLPVSKEFGAESDLKLQSFSFSPVFKHKCLTACRA